MLIGTLHETEFNLCIKHQIYYSTLESHRRTKHLGYENEISVDTQWQGMYSKHEITVQLTNYIARDAYIHMYVLWKSSYPYVLSQFARNTVERFPSKCIRLPDETKSDYRVRIQRKRMSVDGACNTRNEDH